MVCLKINSYCFDCQPRIYKKLSLAFESLLQKLSHRSTYYNLNGMELSRNCTGILRSQLSSNNA